MRPISGEEKQHKKWISDIKKRMLTSTQGGPDRVFVKEVIRRADPANSCESLDAFFKDLTKNHIQASKIIEEGMTFGYGKRDRDPENTGNADKAKPEAGNKKTGVESRHIKSSDHIPADKIGGVVMCNGCGMNNHAQTDCQFKDVHPDYNTSALPWPDSDSGKACQVNGMTFLNWRKRKDGTDWTRPLMPPNAKRQERAAKYRDRPKSGSGGH